MRFFSERPVLRWLAPLALVLVVAGASLVATTATADPKLPPRTAEQLLVDLQQAKVDGLSGTVTQKANLGIPALPGGSGSRSSDFNSLLSGNHTMKVWYAGPDKARIALLGTLGESDLIVNGSDVWTWSSDDNAATHRTIDRPARDRAKDGAPDHTPTDMPKTPQEAAERFLAAVGPTTEIATDSHVTVAGRAAYELVLQPRDDRSLISQVRIAVDGEKKVPLQVQVLGQGTDPVAEVKFSSIDFNVPDAGQFAFNPPPGTKVTEVKPEDDGARKDVAEKKSDQLRKERADAGAKVIGTGWTTVVVTKLKDPKAVEEGAGEFRALLEQLPKVSGKWGSGRVLSGTAFSAVLSDDGRLAVGTVKPAVLYDALQR